MSAMRWARLWVVVAVLPVLGLTGMGVAVASPISGKFTIAGKTIPVKEVAAFRIRDQFNPRAYETYIMVTAKPVNRAAIAASLDPYSVAINDPAVSDADYLAFSVRPDGETSLNAHVGGTQYVDTSGTMMGQKGSLIATCRENTATRVACTVKTDKPVKPMDGPTWTLDMTFEADVASRTPGKPLAKDGEAPGGPARSAQRAHRQGPGQDPGPAHATGSEELPGGLPHAGGESRFGQGDPRRPPAEEAQDHRRRDGGRRPRRARSRRRAVRERQDALPGRHAAHRREVALRRVRTGGDAALKTGGMENVDAAAEPLLLAGRRLYSPIAIAVYSVVFNFPIAGVLLGLNLRARGNRMMGTILIVLSALAGAAVLGLAAGARGLAGPLLFGVVGGYIAYQMERRLFAVALLRARRGRAGTGAHSPRRDGARGPWRLPVAELEPDDVRRLRTD